MNLEYEFSDYSQSLPVYISNRKSSSQSVGCYFHWHEEIEFYFVIRGGVNLLCGGTNSWIHSGHLGVVNWCEPHKSIGFLDNTEHYIIKIDLSSPVFSFIPISKYDIPKLIDTDSRLHEHFVNMIDLYKENNQDNFCSIVGECYSIFGDLLKLSTIKSNESNRNLLYIREILTYIHLHWNQEMELSKISDLTKISPSHMCRVFKKYTGKTIIEYTNKIKFSIAISYIQKGFSIAEASAMVGFDDYNYFSRAFKKSMGTSPSSYKPNSE